VAAVLAYPDGSMSAAGLRRSGVSIERTNGKDYTTLADIEEMRKQCRVQAKARAFNSRKPKTDNGSGSFATGSEPSALDALRATAKALKENLPNTSPPSTTPRQAEAAVIPMQSK